MNLGEEDIVVTSGGRVAHVVLERISNPKCIEVNDLDETRRSGKGFGGTGVKENLSSIPEEEPGIFPELTTLRADASGLTAREAAAIREAEDGIRETDELLYQAAQDIILGNEDEKKSKKVKNKRKKKEGAGSDTCHRESEGVRGKCPHDGVVILG